MGQNANAHMNGTFTDSTDKNYELYNNNLYHGETSGSYTGSLPAPTRGFSPQYAGMFGVKCGANFSTNTGTETASTDASHRESAAGSNARRRPQTINISKNTTHYVCTTCFRTFKRPSDLERHAKKHRPDSRIHQCPVQGCEYRSNYRKDKLREHVKRCHPGLRV